MHEHAALCEELYTASDSLSDACEVVTLRYGPRHELAALAARLLAELAAVPWVVRDLAPSWRRPLRLLKPNRYLPAGEVRGAPAGRMAAEEHRRIGLDMQAAIGLLSNVRVAMGARRPRSTSGAERTYAAQRLRRMRKAFGALWTRLDDAAADEHGDASLRYYLGPAPRPASTAPR